MLEDALAKALTPEMAWNALQGLRQGSLPFPEYVNSFYQCVKAARASEEVRPILFRQGLLQATQQLLLTIPPAGSLDQEISVVADVLQRQKLLATQSLPLRQLTPPVHPQAFFFSSSAKSANKDQQSSSCLLFVSFTLSYKNPKGKVLHKRVKALLDSGSEKNYLNKKLQHHGTYLLEMDIPFS